MPEYQLPSGDVIPLSGAFKVVPGVDQSVIDLNGSVPAADGVAGITLLANTFPARSSAGAAAAKAISDDALAFVAAANNAAMRTALGLGTAATQNTGTSGATLPFLNGANTWATTQTFTAAPVFTDASGTRTALGLVIGTNVQAYDATLAALASYVTTAGGMLYGTGTDAFANLPNPGAAAALTHDGTTPIWVTALAKAQQHTQTAYKDANNIFSVFQEVTRTGSTNSAFGVRVSTDAVDRLLIRADGRFSWGDGTNPVDWILAYQSAALMGITGGLNMSGKLGVGLAALTGTPVAPIHAQLAGAGITDCIAVGNHTTAAAGVGAAILFVTGTAGVNSAARIAASYVGSSKYDLSFQVQLVAAAGPVEVGRYDATNGVWIYTGGMNITGKLDHDGTTVGFYGVTPAARPSAITQTYSTADKTHAARTTAALTDSIAGTISTTLAAIPDPADTPATADALRDDLVANVLPKIRNALSSIADQVGKNRTDCQDSAQLLNSVVDDLQTLGLEQ